MRIPFTDMEFVVFDSMKDGAYFYGVLCVSGAIIYVYYFKEINVGFCLLFIGLVSLSFSRFVPTVSLFEFWELKKQYKLKKLKEWRK